MLFAGGITLLTVHVLSVLMIFIEFDLILGMDDRNIDALKEKAPDVETERKIGRMTDYCRVKVVDYVPDPYYGGAQGFENVLDILEDACGGLLDSLTQEL